MNRFLALSLTCVAMAAQLQTSATVWRVNNQGFSADYTNLQTAIDDNNNVNPGDTLHVEPSPVSYGVISLNRRFTLIGPGFFLNQNVTPPLQANPNMASVLSITLQPAASGSKLTGLGIGGNAPSSHIYINASNIEIDRCHGFEGGVVFINNALNQLSNVTITRCYFAAGIGASQTPPGPVSNLLISNNYFGNLVQMAVAHQGVLAHNVFTNGVSIYGMSFYNNILRTGNMAQNPGYNGINNVHHNIFHNDPGAWVNGGNNFVNIAMNAVFPTNSTTDGNWQPLNSCIMSGPCGQGTGTPAVHIGMYGGNTPYVLSGIPAIPAIYELSTSPTAVQGQPLPVAISTRSND